MIMIVRIDNRLLEYVRFISVLSQYRDIAISIVVVVVHLLSILQHTNSTYTCIDIHVSRTRISIKYCKFDNINIDNRIRIQNSMVL